MRLNEEKLALMRSRVHKPQPDPNAKLERVKSIATIVSAIAIPVVLTISGYFIQRQLADEGLKKDYVGIAAGILKENGTAQEPELRTWAVHVLELNSPVPFSQKAKAGLLIGTDPVLLAGPPWRSPPPGCRKPPAKSTIPAKIAKLRKEAEGLNQSQIIEQANEFVQVVLKQDVDAEVNRIRLECLQSWVNQMEKVDNEYRKSIGARPRDSYFEDVLKERTARAASTTRPKNDLSTSGK